MTCKKHPNYKAVYKPKADCLECWKIYAEKLERHVRMLETKVMTELAQLRSLVVVEVPPEAMPPKHPYVDMLEDHEHKLYKT